MLLTVTNCSLVSSTIFTLIHYVEKQPPSLLLCSCCICLHGAIIILRSWKHCYLSPSTKLTRESQNTQNCPPRYMQSWELNNNNNKKKQIQLLWFFYYNVQLSSFFSAPGTIQNDHQDDERDVVGICWCGHCSSPSWTKTLQSFNNLVPN